MAANLYNSARVRMLSSLFDWEQDNKYLVLLGDGFVFVPTHLTLDQCVTGVYWEAGKIVSPAITATGWAGSSPLTFAALAWPEPIYRAMLTEVLTGLDPLLPVNHTLICDLDNVIAYPFATDGLDKQISWNSASGAQGWFAP